MSVVTRRYIRCDGCKREEPVTGRLPEGWEETYKQRRFGHTCPSCLHPAASLFEETA